MNRKRLIPACWMLAFCLGPGSLLPEEARPGGEGLENPFFAMSTGTVDESHRSPRDQASLLAELGYAGTDHMGVTGLGEKLAAVDAAGLKLFALYTGATIDGDGPGYDPGLKAAVEALSGRETIIWLFVTSKRWKPSSEEGDPAAVKVLRSIADLAAEARLRVALYPHTGFWLERVEDAVRLAGKVGRRNLGVTFNLCHALRVDGEAGLEARLERAMPHLFLITINGADRDGTDWKSLIQTLDRGTFDQRRFLSAVKRIGFSGPIGLQGYGIGGDVRDNLTRSIAAWRKIGGAASGEGRIRVLAVTGGHDYDREAFDRIFTSDPGIEYRHEEHPAALRTLTSAAAEGFDAIVLYDLYQRITDEEKTLYARLVRSGKGVLALHHTLASFQAWPEYERIIGGKFFLEDGSEDGVAVPRSGVRFGVDLLVEIADPLHPITRGLENFTIHDEVYNRFRVHPAAQVLLRTSHPDSGPVIGWAQPYGRGRVVYLQMGHDDHAYSNPGYRALVSRSIRWAARRAPEDAGFKPIFNGRDLSGWEPAGNARFVVEDGILIGRQGASGEAGDLLSEAEYGDFELEATWAMDWPGNSGVWFRYQSPSKAYQADILEWKEPVCWSGTVYCTGKMFIARNTDPTIIRRDGWNTFAIRAAGERITVTLNGRRVADVQDSTSARGRIGFQVHAGGEFSNMAIRIADIRIRELR